jgi:glycosyltransferase involved in cell wall biosynthesis
MMPFYGRFDHFKLAVESVITQTDRDWRLVIVDDVYPDLEPGLWAQSLGDERITYIRNEENLRPSRNYRKCVSLMETDFAVLMGCDDVMRPNYVSRVKELIRRFPDASVIQPGVRTIDSDGAASRPLADRMKAFYRLPGSGPRTATGEVLAVSLLRGNWTYFPSLCWRVSALKEHGFRLDLDVVQDLAMLFEITKGGGILVVDDEVCFDYRRHGTSVSAVTGPDGSKFRQELTFFGEAARDSAALGWPKAARVAKRHLSSRLNALTELPGAIRAGNANGRRSLWKHIFGATPIPAPAPESRG